MATPKRNVVVPAPLLEIIAICLAEAGRISRHPITGGHLKVEIANDAALAAAKDAVQRLCDVTVVASGYREDRAPKPKNGRRTRWQMRRKAKAKT